MSTDTRPVLEEDEATAQDIFWGKVQLDRTPVADLESWHREYDPSAAADLDRRLDEAFGPVVGAR